MSEAAAARNVTPWVRRCVVAMVAVGGLWIAMLVLFGAFAAFDHSVDGFVKQATFTLLGVFTVSVGVGYVAARLRQGQHDLHAHMTTVAGELRRLRAELDERDGKLYGHLCRRLDLIDGSLRRRRPGEDTEPIVATAAVVMRTGEQPHPHPGLGPTFDAELRGFLAREHGDDGPPDNPAW